MIDDPSSSSLVYLVFVLFVRSFQFSWHAISILYLHDYRELRDMLLVRVFMGGWCRAESYHIQAQPDFRNTGRIWPKLDP